MTKTDITKALNETRKGGWLWYHFNSQRAMPTGAKGWPDHVGIHPASGLMICIEVKLGKDRASLQQVECLNALMSISGIETIVFPNFYLETIGDLQNWILK